MNTATDIQTHLAGWIVVHVTADGITLHTTTHTTWPGVLTVQQTRDWGRVTYHVDQVPADRLTGGGSAEFTWKDGALVRKPRRFRNGNVRPLNQRTHPTAEQIAEAVHLIRAMGWES